MLLKIIHTHARTLLFRQFLLVDTIVSHTSQSYGCAKFGCCFSLGFGGEKNKCQKRIKAEIQHKYEMTSCESDILDGLMYYVAYRYCIMLLSKTHR